MHMKYHILVFALFTGLAISCEREISPGQADRFIKFYGNYLMDEASDVETLDDGGFAICGVDSLPGVGNRMILIVTDEYGNLKSGFPKYYPESDTVIGAAANAIVPVRGGQGGFLLAGYVELQVEGSAETQKDIYLVKVSSTGDVNWQRTYGSADDEVVLDATERISSGFMLAGYRVKNGKSAIMIMGVEQEGDSIRPGYPSSTYTQNSSANYILNAGDRYLCICTYDKLGHVGITDMYALCFDDGLNPNARRLSGDSNEQASCIIEDGPNSYLALGNKIIGGRSEIVIYQFETNDQLYITQKELIKTISESNMDLIGKRFVKTLDGRYAIVGTMRSGTDRQIFLQFLTPDKDPSDRVLYGASGDQYGADIDISKDGGLVLLGTTGYEENSMISLIKTNDTGDL
jgi:hypothetical protein